MINPIVSTRPMIPPGDATAPSMSNPFDFQTWVLLFTMLFLGAYAFITVRARGKAQAQIQALKDENDRLKKTPPVNNCSFKDVILQAVGPASLTFLLSDKTTVCTVVMTNPTLPAILKPGQILDITVQNNDVQVWLKSPIPVQDVEDPKP